MSASKTLARSWRLSLQPPSRRPVARLSFAYPHLQTGHGLARRTYYTPLERSQPSVDSTQQAILSAALHHVPSTGFTKESMLLGARDAGYSPASLSLMSRGAYDLVSYHLVCQRLALKETAAQDVAKMDRPIGAAFSSKLRHLLLTRLLGNEPIVSKLQEAFGLMSLYANISPSLAELGRLSDEIWFLAGDVSVDGSWYTKRASLAAVYASTEVFMSQDTSKDFKETRAFLDRRLAEAKLLGNSAKSVGEWLSFAGLSSVQVLRSLGARI